MLKKFKTLNFRKFIIIIVVITVVTTLAYGFIWRPLYLYKRPAKLFDYCAYRIEVNEDFAYVTHNNGVKIYSVSGNTFFNKRAKIKTDDPVYGITVVDNLAYLSGENALLMIFDVTNPYTPELLSNFKPNWASEGIYVEDGFAYVSNINGEVHIIDVSNPREPNITTKISINAFTRGIRRYMDYLYIGVPEQSLIIYDVSNIANPKEIKKVPNTYGVNGIYIHKDKMYLACNTNGVKVFGVENPADPIRISSFYDSGECRTVTANDNYIFVGNMKKGIEVWDNTSKPELLYKENKFTTYIPHSIALYGDYLLLADQDSGFVMIDWTKLVD